MSQNVSRETISKLKTYQGLLETWQEKINLVSSSTLEAAWERHFEDSLQLLTYIPDDAKSLIDLGSGAGFPGLVLAIAIEPDLEVTLVESDLKKVTFLEIVSRETIETNRAPVTVLRERIEKVKNLKADVITARALTSLEKLLEYAYPLSHSKTTCLFLKGESVDGEIEMAKKKWDFELEIFPSLTDSRGRILKIKNLKRARACD